MSVKKASDALSTVTMMIEEHRDINEGLLEGISTLC